MENERYSPMSEKEQDELRSASLMVAIVLKEKFGISADHWNAATRSDETKIALARVLSRNVTLDDEN